MAISLCQHIWFCSDKKITIYRKPSMYLQKVLHYALVVIWVTNRGDKFVHIQIVDVTSQVFFNQTYVIIAVTPTLFVHKARSM